MTHTKSEVESIEEERIFFNLEDETAVEEPQHSHNLDKTENKTKIYNEQFNKYLIEAIDETLTSLGEPVKNALYHNLECNFGITKNDIPEKINNFSSILHKIFGLGASRLEVKFMKNLNDKIHANIKWSEPQAPFSKWLIMNLSFEEYVFKIREDYIQKNY